MTTKEKMINDIKTRYSLKNYDLVTEGKVGRYDTIVVTGGYITYLYYKQGSGMWARGKLISELDNDTFIFRRRKPVKKCENLSAIVNTALYLASVDKDLGYVPDYALAGLSVTVEEARKIRDIIQERKKTGYKI